MEEHKSSNKNDGFASVSGLNFSKRRKCIRCNTSIQKGINAHFAEEVCDACIASEDHDDGGN